MTPPLTITLDWKAYFAAFSEAHGGNPVHSGGRLLFADGWTYSASDHAGPEWPPPRDPDRLRALQAPYWRERRAIVKLELDTLRGTLEGLAGLQAHKSARLHHVVRVQGDDGRPLVKKEPLDPEMYRERLKWLSDDLADCEAQLAVLEPKEAVTQ